MMNAQSMPFSKIIGSDQGSKDHYHVPKYQREYTWGKREWDQLLLDIDENDPGYFMGSIICVSDSEPQSPGDEMIFEVVDGQQRMTTLSLLMMAIYKKLKDRQETIVFEDDDEASEYIQALGSLKNKLVKRKKDGKPSEEGAIKDGKNTCFCRVMPSSQNHNLDDYKYLLGDLGVLPKSEKPRNCGNRLMMRAYRYFLEEIGDETDALLKMVGKLNQLNFVHISVASQSDAFTLFETLNNRGVPLSAIDIIKNKMLAELDKKHSTGVDESYESWQRVIDSIPDAADQERFLRHFYHAFKSEPKLYVDGVNRVVRSKIIHVYERLIKRDAPLLCERLIEAGDVYGDLLQADGPWSDQVKDNLLDLTRIGAAPAYQLLLYLFKRPDGKISGSKTLEAITDLICRYNLRRNLTDLPPTREMDPVHIEVIEECEASIKSHGSLTFEAFSKALLKGRGEPAGIEKLREALTGDIYSENPTLARYILCKLDSTQHTREYAPDLWARDDRDKFVWTIEHVLPQTPNLPKDWIQMLGDGDKEAAADAQARCVDQIGNLTLSAYNSKLSTRSLSKKQIAKTKHSLGHQVKIGYRNGLALNDLAFRVNGKRVSLANTHVWDEATINSRTQVIVEKLVELYKFPGEK